VRGSLVVVGEGTRVAVAGIGDGGTGVSVAFSGVASTVGGRAMGVAVSAGSALQATAEVRTKKATNIILRRSDIVFLFRTPVYV
jgi:hypothetical protein